MGAAILEQQEQLAYKESFPTTNTFLKYIILYYLPVCQLPVRVYWVRAYTKG